ncbi:MAG TPA: glutathione S-transferase family protein, partial [Hyphomonas sp.]
PLIEASWKRICKVLEAMATGPTRFLFGDRISLADLGFYGQLKVMSVDPTPMTWLRADTPYLYRWIDHADDASGIEGNWSDSISPVVHDLLAIAGETYLPFLKANLDGLNSGSDSFSLEIERGRYEQGVFKYQARCLQTLGDAWKDLDVVARDKLAEWIGPNASILSTNV